MTLLISDTIIAGIHWSTFRSRLTLHCRSLWSWTEMFTFHIELNISSPNSTLFCAGMTYGVLWSMRDVLWLVLGWSVYRPGNGLRGWWVWPLCGSGVPDGSLSTANAHPEVCCGYRYCIYCSVSGAFCSCAAGKFQTSGRNELVCVCVIRYWWAVFLCNQAIRSSRSKEKKKNVFEDYSE